MPAPQAAPRPFSWKWVRVGLLLLVLAGAGLRYLRVKRAEAWVPDWERTETVTVLLLVPGALSGEEQRALDEVRRGAARSEEQATFWELKRWFQREHARYVQRAGYLPVEFIVMGPHPYQGLPPAPPRAGEELSLAERYQRTSDFLGFFAELRRTLGVRSPTTVHVLLYRPQDADLFASIHSVADRRSRSGFVFAPLTEGGLQVALINTAHETLHLFGATDKYAGDRCQFPRGFYEPHRQPRFPQRFAEVMAQGIPHEDGSAERALELFHDMRVGVATAAEVGWIPQARADRYYAGDASQGGREEQ